MNTKWYEGWPPEASVLEVEEGDILEFSIPVDNKTSKLVQYRALLSGDLRTNSTIEPANLHVGPGGSSRILVRITPPLGLHEAVLEVFRGSAHHDGGEPSSITIKCKAASPHLAPPPDPPIIGGGDPPGGEGPLGGGDPPPQPPDNPPVTPPPTPVNPGSEAVVPPAGVQPGGSGAPGSSPSSTTSTQTTGGGQPSATGQKGSIGMSSAIEQPTQTTGGSQGTSGESKPVGIDHFKQEQEELLRKAAEEKERREAQRRRPEQFEADVTVDDPPRDGGSITLRPGQRAKILIPVSFDLEEAPNRNATREFGLTVTNPLALFNHEAVKVEWGSESIPAGESALLFFLLNVPTNTPQGRYEFVISVTAGQRSSEDRHMTLVVEPVAAVQVAAEKTEALQRFLPPRSCTFDLTVHNHPLGNTPTAYRLAVKRPEDNAAAKIPYDDADLYETPDWEILFDDELNDVRREDNSTKLVGNYHKLTVKRKGIWWFGFQEKLPLKVEAIPVTEPGNSSLPGSSLDLLLTRQRLIPISSWLAVPLITLLLLFLMMASSSPTLEIKNGLKFGETYYVFADSYLEKQPQKIQVDFRINNGGPIAPRLVRRVDDQDVAATSKTKDDFELTAEEYHKSVDYVLRPLFGRQVTQKVVFLGYRTQNQFFWTDPNIFDLEKVSQEEPTGVQSEAYKLDLDDLKSVRPDEFTFRLFNEGRPFKVVIAYASSGSRFVLSQAGTGEKGILEISAAEGKAGKQLIIKDTRPNENSSEELVLMTTDGRPRDDGFGVRIYRITITRGGGE